jgi:hypothetical protein
LGIFESDQLDDRRIQLILISHRRGAPLQVTHVTTLIGDDQGALKLAHFGGVDAEVG